VLLAHCGPSGLGSEAGDPCGRDWKKPACDWGDQDLALAIRQIRRSRPLPLVAFGHMHHALKRGQGDVLLNWENEAVLARKAGEFKGEVKVFSPNVLTEQPVAIVDKVVDKRGTRKVAQAFLTYLYTPTAQKIFVDKGFRPVTPEGKAYARGKFPAVKTYTIEAFGGWPAVTSKFFRDGAIWDQIFRASR